MRTQDLLEYVSENSECLSDVCTARQMLHGLLSPPSPYYEYCFEMLRQKYKDAFFDAMKSDPQLAVESEV